MILSTFSAISVITGGVLAVQSWADVFPLTTKGWVEGYVAKELIPVTDAQASANGRTTQVQSDLSSLTIQTLNFQILQMQIQLGPLEEKDGSMSIEERQLAERLKREIGNAQSMLSHAQCVQANEIRITQIPCQ